MREKAKEFGNGDIYILTNLNDHTPRYLEDINLFDAIYDFPPIGSEMYNLKKANTSIYTLLIHKNKDFINLTKSLVVFRGSMLEYDDTSINGNNGTIFDDYSPEKFYKLNKIIIEWTRSHYNIPNRFIFVNSWNEWSRGCYLEPDEKYGYSSINALSKALFNISFRENNYNLSNLTNSSNIVVQAHIFYQNLIEEIINKINNIPVKYDLFITTNTYSKFRLIEEYIKKNSNANKYKIKIEIKEEMYYLY